MIAHPEMSSKELWPYYNAHMDALKAGHNPGLEMLLARVILSWHFDAIERELKAKVNA